MLKILFLAGLIYVTNAAEVPEFDNFFSFISNNNKYTTSNYEHKTNKSLKIASGQRPFEMSFPLIYDIFPMDGFEGKMKLFQDDKDSSEGGEQRSFSKIFKTKKKPKDKVIVSFSEFFIPFSNHKSSYDISGIPKKFDFFEDFFKEFEEPVLKHRVFKKIFNNTNATKNSIFEKLFANSSTNSDAAKKNFVYHNPKEDMFLIQDGLGDTKRGLEKQNQLSNSDSCCGHAECKMIGHCQVGLCSDKPPEEELYNANREKDIKMIEAINLEKLIKIALLYTIPIMLGIGGIIIAIEVIRKHKSVVKNKKIVIDYDPLQRC